jgi:hypothetical protein
MTWQKTVERFSHKNRVNEYSLLNIFFCEIPQTREFNIDYCNFQKVVSNLTPRIQYWKFEIQINSSYNPGVQTTWQVGNMNSTTKGGTYLPNKTEKFQVGNKRIRIGLIFKINFLCHIIKLTTHFNNDISE